MTEIHTTRAAFLLGSINLLDQVGAPVHRLLERAGLPARIEEYPEARVSTHLTYKFLEDSARCEGILDLDWRSAEPLLHTAVNKVALAPYLHGNIVGERLKAMPKIAAKLE